ncbi:cobyric acid synthase [Thermoflavimicrobium daqui]|jgi:adenosylcobyric acid synthase|uniref:Cobyric acid synthase n=1 Tax=Thermoflavimicrobium daqui TaxID=2137476 RepID=A0A364K7N2_9BACL|nr:cobyric acid synthase [Thermoflavimicrobium daqui]RAL26297.1 cobyric acid synthase [Thermoflavimicrobium daqui]
MKAIMLQGTGSDVGKSVICTALCRYFYQQGYRVAPFKSQNMALNSYVTQDGKEIGRAQGVQAEAAGIEALVDMNPILLKPKGEMVSEVVVHGRHFADMEAGTYRAQVLEKMLQPVQESLDRLAQSFELLVIEGAGSPAEINLKDRDIANMRVAKLAKAPVILVADIERGGVFASIIGTLALLDPDEKKRVKGFIINKFRGRKELLDSGITWLEQETGLPVLGVLPYMEMKVDPEDSMALESLQFKSKHEQRNRNGLDIAIIRFPRISNFTDFLPLWNQPDVYIRYIKSRQELKQPDVIILPGTKNTIEDLHWLRETGLADEILRLHQQGSQVVGICGGYQMLGEKLIDEDQIESNERVIEPGLNLLQLKTWFVPQKKTIRVSGEILAEFGQKTKVEGYEIHLGRTQRIDERPFVCLDDGRLDGAISIDERVWGTYLHGIFDNDHFTSHWLNQLRRQKGIPEQGVLLGSTQKLERDKVYDDLADWIKQYINLQQLKEIIGLTP